MTDIRPRIVDGEAVCTRECPLNRIGECNRCDAPQTFVGDPCSPHYRALSQAQAETIREITTRIEMVDDGMSHYSATDCVADIRAALDGGND
jgi:hypothetical protein